MKSLKCFLSILAVLFFCSCSNTHFSSTWHSPAASSVNLQKRAVAAFLISGNEAVRRSFEQNLATELTRRGVETLPGYEVLPNTDVTNKNEILKRLQSTSIDAAIFMRIVGRHQEVTFVPGTWYAGPYYDPFFWRYGRFYGPAFAGPWPPFYDPGYFQTDTVVSVSTLIYSVPDSNLLWAGTSETLNPAKVRGFVKELVSATMKKLKDVGMVPKTA
jgi:hypothetical protein